MSAEEQVVIVDDHNNVVGQTSRREMRAHNLIHRATYILVHNRNNDFFLQKRTTTKDIFPGYFDPATGGVVTAGESYELSAARELAEELGVSGVNLQELFDFYWQDERCRVWGRAYLCQWDGPVMLQPEEVESGCFCPLDAILAGQYAPLTPDGEYVLRRYAAGRSVVS